MPERVHGIDSARPCYTICGKNIIEYRNSTDDLDKVTCGSCKRFIRFILFKRKKSSAEIIDSILS